MGSILMKTKPVLIQSNNGTEFIGKEFQHILDKHIIPVILFNDSMDILFGRKSYLMKLLESNQKWSKMNGFFKTTYFIFQAISQGLLNIFIELLV